MHRRQERGILWLHHMCINNSKHVLRKVNLCMSLCLEVQCVAGNLRLDNLCSSETKNVQHSMELRRFFPFSDLIFCSKSNSKKNLNQHDIVVRSSFLFNEVDFCWLQRKAIPMRSTGGKNKIFFSVRKKQHKWKTCFNKQCLFI